MSGEWDFTTPYVKDLKSRQEFCESYKLTLFIFLRTQNVLGEKGRRIRELTAVVQKRFGFPEGSVEVSDRAYARDYCGPGDGYLEWYLYKLLPSWRP